MELTIRKGGIEDIDNLSAFLQEIREGMEHKEWFYLDPPEDLREFMVRGIMDLWLAMDDNRIAAMFYTIVPGLSEINYGQDLDCTEEELLRVVHMDTVAVHPEYRGLGLHRKLVALAEEELSSRGEAILLCTVHPDNCYSLRNVLAQGYTIQKRLEKYGSVRYILRKDILPNFEKTEK